MLAKNHLKNVNVLLLVAGRWGEERLIGVCPSLGSSFNNKLIQLANITEISNEAGVPMHNKD